MLKNLCRLKNANQLWRQTQMLLKVSQQSFARTLVTTERNSFAQTEANENAEKLHDLEKQTKQLYKNPFSTASKQSAKEGTKETSLSDETATQEEEACGEQLVELDEEQKKRLKVLQLEVDIAHQEGRRVPQLNFFKDHHWHQVLAMPSKSARYKYYGYLWQIEMKKEAKERKKLERAVGTAKRKEEMQREREENTHIIYGLGHTSMFLRVYDSTINHWQNHRLIRAMQFSPKIVLDCSYDQHMTKREAINASKQLMLCFAENRAHDDPFDLHYCNVSLKSDCMQSLQRYIPTMLNPEFPMNVHDKCFTQLFPKEKLVYLTPHCRTDLEVYNHDDIYIVGAMVDTVNNEPLSLAKAKKLGIRMARLPLDRYLQWGSGSGKSLTLNQMMNIMLDLKSTGDWSKSLSHVPRRKIINNDEMENYQDYNHDRYDNNDRYTGRMQQRNKLHRRANQLNIRMDKILNENDNEHNNDERGKFDAFSTKKMRSHKDNLQFNLDTWATKKKNRNS